jgi:hypothetical protein
MVRVWSTVVGVVVVGMMAAVVRGGPPVMNRQVTDSLKAADVIVAVTVEGFTPDADFKPQTSASDGPTGFRMFAINPPGVYRFKRVLVVKGECEEAFELHLPLLSDEVLGHRGLKVPVGSPVLLVLKKDGEGKLVPVDPILPLIPLSADAVAAAPGAAATQKAVDGIGLMLASLGDARVRVAVATLLDPPLGAGLPDDRIPAAMRAYEDDKDDVVQGHALSVLGRAQDVTVIPKIAKFLAAHNGGGPAGVLQHYKKPEAVPYLNPLILEGTEYARLNAAMALREIADATSIPYLMLALDKDDRQHIVSYDAYATLHRLIGERKLPPVLSVSQFQANKAEEVGVLKQWWAWEKRKWNAATMPAGAAEIGE